MDKLLSMLLIVGIVILIFWLSSIREKRVQMFSDEFAKAFLEASDYVLDTGLQNEELIYTIESRIDQSGKEIKNPKKQPVKLVPLEEQPETLQKLFRKGIDSYVLERFQIMHIKRDGAQLQLTSINLIEKKYNSALNRIYDIANISFSALQDYAVLNTLEDIENFHFFLHGQDFLRNTTLASIMSKAAKRKLNIV